MPVKAFNMRNLKIEDQTSHLLKLRTDFMKSQVPDPDHLSSRRQLINKIIHSESSTMMNSSAVTRSSRNHGAKSHTNRKVFATVI